MSSALLAAGEIDGSGVESEGVQVLCEHCSEIDFNRLGIVMREELSALRSRAEFCTFCELLLRQLNKSYGFASNRTGPVEIWRVQHGLALGSRSKPLLSIYKIPSAGVSTTLRNIPIGLPKLPTTFGPTYFGILRKWLADCDTNHAGCQIETTEQSGMRTPTPTRLIDVKDRKASVVRLVESKEDRILKVQQLKYIAVSHPWGAMAENNHYCTTRENISQHKKGILIDVLPATFKDAIRVTQELGVRYIWIDSLCIVQGEGGDFDEEAKHMETVFSSAYCVIAATRAKGMSSGFLTPRPSRRVVKFKRPGEDPFYICEAIDNFQGDVIEGSLNKRGWVLQERALARRSIYFAENQTYWECGEGVRCETLTRMKNNQAALLGDSKFPKVATMSPKGGQIRLYELLYKQYSRLQFTRVYDRPLAIAGLEQRLIRAFATQGGYGVFTRYFGRSLLWQRDTSATPHGMTPIQFPKTQRYQVPSWSWMAYEGAITFMDLPFGGVDWEEKEIRSPWSPPSPVLVTSATFSTHLTSETTATWYTANSNERIDLTAIARDFSASADNLIVYDAGERPKDRTPKCVIVGRQKRAETDDKRTYYVLVVAGSPGASRHPKYKRIGVGALPGNTITREGSGLKVQVF